MQQGDRAIESRLCRRAASGHEMHGPELFWSARVLVLVCAERLKP